MRKFILAVVPLILAAITIVLIKPSEEKCRIAATEKLTAAGLPAAPENIIVKDYFFMRVLKYAYRADTFKLGSAAFFQVRVKDDRIEKIKAHGK